MVPGNKNLLIILAHGEPSSRPYSEARKQLLNPISRYTGHTLALLKNINKQPYETHY